MASFSDTASSSNIVEETISSNQATRNAINNKKTISNINNNAHERNKRRYVILALMSKKVTLTQLVDDNYHNIGIWNKISFITVVL